MYLIVKAYGGTWRQLKYDLPERNVLSQLGDLINIDDKIDNFYKMEEQIIL